MKQRKMRIRDHGAVTVFLTLILIPCMIFTCVFGDVGRVSLSKSQAAGAADLALYSLMANYDEDLKEWYGLVSSCQTIDQFYDVSAQYFVGMMSANGIDGTASDNFLAYLDGVRNGDFANFLQVEGLNDVEIKAVDDGAMGGNPALIEDGIVEFMKYRGPVVIVENLINRFSQMDFSGLTDANENEPIVEAKQEYAEAEGKMMSDMLYTYLAIEQYMDYRAANGVPDMYKYQHDYPEKLSHMFTDFGKMTETITEYYAATDGIKNLSLESGYGSFPLYALPDTNNLNNEADAILYVGRNYTYTMESIGAVEDEDGNHTLSEQALENLLSTKDSHVANVKNAAKGIVDACSGITVPTATNQVNDAIYCMRMQNAISSSNLNTIQNDGKALMQLYAKLILAQWCDFPETSKISMSQRISDTMTELAGIQRDYLSYNQSPSSSFEKLLSDYKSVADDTVEDVKERRYEFYSEYCGRSVTVGGFLDDVRGELGPLLKHLDKQITNINTILNGGWIIYPTNGGKLYAVVSLETLKNEIVNYSSARDNWGSEANRADTDYARSERDEYNGVAAANDLPAALYENGEEAARVLRTRLTNIKGDMQALKTALESCTYGGKRIDTLTREPAIAAARTVVPTSANNISLSLTENAAAAQGYHQQLMHEANYTPPSLIPGEDGNEPDLTRDIPELYQFMRESFHKEELEKAVNEKDKQEEENKKNQDEANEKAKSSKGMEDGYLRGLGTLNPKEINSSNPFGAGTLLDGLVGAVTKIMNGNFDEFRDEIYVCTYIMEMFSYSSYNNEGCYNLAKDKGSSYTKKLSEAYQDNDLIKEWQEQVHPKFTQNKSLTNHMINEKNNRSNLAEVEYVLFGKDTNKENLEAAYGTIFAIRETLNLISGFANFYPPTKNATAGAIESIAVAVATATMGIIPEPVTKVVLIGVLATMETAHDMQRLKAGTPVVVYKLSDKNWYYKLPSDAKDISSLFSGTGFEDPDEPNGLFYSDYMLLFLMIASSGEDTYSSMLLRVGDLIEGNMDMQEKNKGFDLEKSQCYFKLTGDLSVKPLFLKLPLVTNYSGASGSKQLLEVTDWCSYSLNIIRGYS